METSAKYQSLTIFPTKWRGEYRQSMRNVTTEAKSGKIPEN
jgi:hypothetical protein